MARSADSPGLPPSFPRLPSAGAWLAPLAAVILLGLVSGLFGMVYTVGPESVGVVQRFGRAIKTVNPGLRFKLPFGIDRVTIVPVKRQLKMEFGFGTVGGSNPDQVFDMMASLGEAIATGLAAFIAETGADELMITAQIHDHAARLRSFELLAGIAAAA